MDPSAIKLFCILGLMALLSSATLNIANAAGECPNMNTDEEARKLIPCWSAARNANAQVSPTCCARVRQIGLTTNPKCLCEVLLSDTAKRFRVNPEAVITIPKRCNFADRPIGAKCGPYTLP